MQPATKLVVAKNPLLDSSCCSPTGLPTGESIFQWTNLAGSVQAGVVLGNNPFENVLDIGLKVANSIQNFTEGIHDAKTKAAAAIVRAKKGDLLIVVHDCL